MASRAKQKRLVEHGAWNSIAVGSDLLKDFGVGGVALIEELTEYELGGNEGGNSETTPIQLPKKKRKIQNVKPEREIEKVVSKKENLRKHQKVRKPKKGKFVELNTKIEDLNEPSQNVVSNEQGRMIKKKVKGKEQKKGVDNNNTDDSSGRKKRLGSKRRKAVMSKRERRKLKRKEESSDDKPAEVDAEVAPTQKKKILTPMEKKERRKLDKERLQAKKKKLQKRKDKLENAAKADKKDETEKPDDRDMSAWKDLFVPAEVLKALAELNFKAPTPIQALTLPPAIRDRRDVIGAAETGSGKTLCFGIPILAHILKKRGENPELPAEVEDDKEFYEDVDGDLEIEEVDDEELKDGAPLDCPLEDLIQLKPSSDEETDEEKITESQCEESDCEETPSKPEPILNYAHRVGNEVLSQHNEIEKRYTKFLDDLEEKYADVDEGSGDEDVEDEGGEEEDEDGPEEVQRDEQAEDEGDNTQEEPQDVTEETVDSEDGQDMDVPYEKPPVALILTPTRELALQVAKHIRAAAKFCNVSVVTVVGGMAPEKQTRLLKWRPEIIIATPGRLWQLLQGGEEHLDAIRYCDMLVIDETDRMIERGHFEELSSIIHHMNQDDTSKRQTLIFSATMTFVHSGPHRSIKKRVEMTVDMKLDKLIKEIGIEKKPAVVDLSNKDGTAAKIVETRLNCSLEEKDVYLYYFLMQYPGRTLVFCNSINCIRRIVSLFTLLGCHPLPLHASMAQRQRLKNVDRFTARDNSLLVASDVAARGLDIPNIQHVVHYQVPRTSETYIHRSGRTARAEKQGVSVVLVSPQDMKLYQRICHNLNKSEHLPLFPVDMKYLPGVKSRVVLAQDVESTEHRMKKEFRYLDWFETQAKEADLEFDLEENELVAKDEDEGSTSKRKRKREKQEDYEKQNEGRHERNCMQRELKGFKKQLGDLLQKPIFPTGFSGRYLTKEGSLNLPSMFANAPKINAVDVAKKEITKLQKLKPSNPVVTAKNDTQKTRERKREKQRSKDKRKQWNREIRGKVDKGDKGEGEEVQPAKDDTPVFTFEMC